MSPVESNCPACGAPLTFKIGSSIVAVCQYCNSVVARGDRRLEDLGKVADLTDTGSPLDVGLKGVFQGVPFELTGRAQLLHQAGGIWDEWYAAFADGRWGWLAEAQGRFYLTFEQTLPGQSLVPPFDMLELSQPVAAIPSSVPLVVAEKGVAQPLGAKGEIPYRLVPGQGYYFADLSGPRGEFATIDYSEQRPVVFVGREVSLSELGLPQNVAAPERASRRVAAVQLSCPKCAGPLALRAPDKTERVTCPNCGSLLDVNQGRLEFLKALTPGKVIPIIPLGSVGEFEGGKLTVIGFLQRSVEFDGVRYYWEEYLLYNPQLGFRWLVRSDDHWNFVQPLGPGAVLDEGRSASFGGNRFKLFQDAAAQVEYVTGEFYWKVTTGELVRAADYVRPPEMLSKEVSLYSVKEDVEQAPVGSGRRGRKKAGPAPVAGEVNWSLGTYIRRREVEKAFGLEGFPDPSTIAPNQPFPHKAIYKYWALLFSVAFLFGIVVFILTPTRKVFSASYALKPVQSAEGTQAFFSDPFALDARKNIKVTASSAVNNSWVYVEGDLIDEATGLVQTFSLPIEYYHGVDDGESWSEGGQSSSVHLSSLPAGNYTLRVEAQWQNWQQPASLSVQIEQGVPRMLYFFLTLLALSIIPLAVAFYHLSFEARRWKDSDYNPYSSGSDSE